MTDLFLDTSYAIALAATTDRHHDRARDLSLELERAGTTRLITTRAILLEIGNALARRRYRDLAVRVLKAIENDSNVEIVSLSDALFASAMHLFGARDDKEWGLTDCVSFVVMQERGITDALTADLHFRQAGFRALLLE